MVSLHYRGRSRELTCLPVARTDVPAVRLGDARQNALFLSPLEPGQPT